jgi:RNA-directed DNA polymerase
MKHRWDFTRMMAVATKLFAKIHKKKKMAHDHHDIHFLAREIKEWLPKGIALLQEGAYSPAHLRRWEFADEVVDSLTIPDRIFQHVLLQELKPTFKHVMNPNCYHLFGPSGVKLASERVKAVLEDPHQKPVYVIRADVKSYYASIPHYKLVQDVNQHYDDPKVQTMCEAIIRNGLETKKGYRNPDKGIALRGPLSQFFSGLYLKPLDEAFDRMMGVTYVRYQDDILIFCQTKRQLNRCKRKMMQVLHERKLCLSRKKTKIGRVEDGFHFLGINYPGTRTQEEYTSEAVQCAIEGEGDVFVDNQEGGGKLNQPSPEEPNIALKQVPHARTFRHGATRSRDRGCSACSRMSRRTTYTTR